MSYTATNFVYELKINDHNDKSEQMISKKLLELCKKQEGKFPARKHSDKLT